MGVEMMGTVIPYWQVFVSLGFLFVTLEAFVGGFFMLPIGIAMFATGILSPFLHNFQLHFWVLAINLLVVGGIFIKFVRPKFTNDHSLTNVDAMVGKEVRVTEKVDNTTGTGQVKLYGDTWRAISMDGSVYSEGESLVVERVEGNKVFVKK